MLVQGKRIYRRIHSKGSYPYKLELNLLHYFGERFFQLILDDKSFKHEIILDASAANKISRIIQDELNKDMLEDMQRDQMLDLEIDNDRFFKDYADRREDLVWEGRRESDIRKDKYPEEENAVKDADTGYVHELTYGR